MISIVNIVNFVSIVNLVSFVNTNDACKMLIKFIKKKKKNYEKLRTKTKGFHFWKQKNGRRV